MSDAARKELNFRPRDKIVAETAGDKVAAIQREITAALAKGDGVTAKELAAKALELNQARNK